MKGARIRLEGLELRDLIESGRALLTVQNEVVGIADKVTPVKFRRGSTNEEVWEQYEAARDE